MINRCRRPSILLIKDDCHIHSGCQLRSYRGRILFHFIGRFYEISSERNI